MSEHSTPLQHNVSGACHTDREPALEIHAASEAALHNRLPSNNGSIAAALRNRFVAQRRFTPIAGAIIVLIAHVIHLLALPLLALLLGTQTGSDGTAPLFSHDNHTISSTTSSLLGANGLLLKWTSDLLVAATIVTAIAMCRATTRLWLRVRQHPLLCLLHTVISVLCVWLAIS
ncbi:hypothetical protein DFQ01_105251 [Paenibacillus cellulosilyticus]|uniref:Uncharacterized protein n=1 Tax=Paenibacillus cellulosilyticus TaxID=375489 RepID=A0A2V2YWY4_9BACL|nr:hypothetical protein [Paenibacillus cellulosilyticus]PWW05266.1 hypothetical protein DFQ01_105251 [Paenibacillus cellulosilyticus]QKS43590.1 hypothetical protein HUB94_03390 [Paenibacillus cellulosilyticus]